MIINDQLLKKLNGLKNMADGAAAVGNTQEAEAFAQKFQELLLKHNMSMEDVEKSSLHKKMEMVKDIIDTDDWDNTANTSNWTRTLLDIVAYYCLCKVVGMKGSTKCTILGERDNVAMTIYFTEQLIAKIMAARSIAWMEYQKHGGAESLYVFRRGFYKGAVLAISNKFSSQETKMAPRDSSMALMVIDKRKEVEDYMLSLYPRLRSKSISLRESRAGHEQGYRAGSNMELNKGLSEKKSQKRLGY